jgi:hypothetical protein
MRILRFMRSLLGPPRKARTQVIVTKIHAGMVDEGVSAEYRERETMNLWKAI